MKPVWCFAVLLLAALAAGCDSPRKELDSHELTVAVKSLGSLSAEAEMLTAELEQRHVTDSFAWTHQQALAQESLKLAGQLTKPLPARLQPAQQEALQLNTQLQAALLQIAKAGSQPEQLAELKHGLQDLAAQVKSLEDGL
jgi:hypothetical protein